MGIPTKAMPRTYPTFRKAVTAQPASSPTSRHLDSTILAFTMSFLAQLYSSRWLLLTAIFAIYAARKYRRYQRLRHFDGPSSAGFFELWHTMTMLGPQTHLVYKAVNDKYGKRLD